MNGDYLRLATVYVRACVRVRVCACVCVCVYVSPIISSRAFISELTLTHPDFEVLRVLTDFDTITDTADYIHIRRVHVTPIV